VGLETHAWQKRICKKRVPAPGTLKKGKELSLFFSLKNIWVVGALVVPAYELSSTFTGKRKKSGEAKLGARKHRGWGASDLKMRW